MIVSTFYRDVHVDRPRFVIFIFHGNFRPSASMQFWHGINSAVPTFSLIFIISLIFFICFRSFVLCAPHVHGGRKEKNVPSDERVGTAGGRGLADTAN